jgi:hypothetical protein
VDPTGELRRQIEQQAGRRLSDEEWEALLRFTAQAESGFGGFVPERKPPWWKTVLKVLLALLIWVGLLAAYLSGVFMIARAAGVEDRGEPFDWSSFAVGIWFVLVIPVYWVWRMLESTWGGSEYHVAAVAAGLAIASPVAGSVAYIVSAGTAVRIGLGVAVGVAGAAVALFVGMFLWLFPENRWIFRDFGRR